MDKSMCTPRSLPLKTGNRIPEQHALTQSEYHYPIGYVRSFVFVQYYQPHAAATNWSMVAARENVTVNFNF